MLKRRNKGFKGFNLSPFTSPSLEPGSHSPSGLAESLLQILVKNVKANTMQNVQNTTHTKYMSHEMNICIYLADSSFFLSANVSVVLNHKQKPSSKK